MELNDLDKDTHTSTSDMTSNKNSINNMVLHFNELDLNQGMRESIKKKFKEIETPFVDGKREERFSPLLRQIMVASGPIVITICSGTTSGFSAILLPQLKENSSSIPITDEQASWIASVAALPMALGCILGGLLMERFGRRTAHLLTCVPYLLGWLMIVLATSLPYVLGGRFLTGLCVGLLGPPSSVYIGETSAPEYRGLLLAAVSLAIAVGLFLSHLLGTFLSWRATAAACATLPLLCALLLASVPESPSWLANKGRLTEAERAFRWCRGYGMEATEEMRAMLNRRRNVSATEPHSGGLSCAKLRSSLAKPEFTKPLLVITVFFLTTQFSGVNAVAFYSVSIMKDTVGDGLNEYLAMIAVDTIRVVMSAAACILTRRFGRRPLALTSGCGTALSLLGLSAFMYLSKRESPCLSPACSWVPLLFLVAYIVFVSAGLVPLPWALTGELFPLALRGLGSGFTSSVNFLAFFTVVKTGPTLFDAYGPEGAFLAYGTVAALGTALLYVLLPETKDKTLQQIEEHFVGGSHRQSKVKTEVT